MPAIEQENILHRLFVFFFSNILSVCLYYCFLHGVLTMPQPLKIYTQKCTSARITCTFSIQSIRKSDARFIFGFFFVIVFFSVILQWFCLYFRQSNMVWYEMECVCGHKKLVLTVYSLNSVWIRFEYLFRLFVTIYWRKEPLLSENNINLRK